MTPDEKETRLLRAMVYGECTDANWIEVKENWMQEASKKWLRERGKIGLGKTETRAIKI